MAGAALVTGGSSGIGLAIAQLLRDEGYDLTLVSRTPEKIEAAAAQLGAAAVVANVADPDDCARAVAAHQERFGRLDVLVGNAAVLGTLSPVGHIEPKVWDEVFATNLTANWRLIRSLDPLLKKSEAGRAIFVTCSAARVHTAYWGAYAASKAALEAMVRVYADELGITAVKANLVDPGILATKLRAKGFPGEDRTKLRQPGDATEPFVALAEAGSQANGEVVIALP